VLTQYPNNNNNNNNNNIKTIKEYVVGSEYVNVPAYNISSWSISCRGTIFTWGADIEQSKVSDIPSRNSETDSFQNGRAEFETKVNLSKKESIEAMPHNNNNNNNKSSYLKIPQNSNRHNSAPLCWLSCYVILQEPDRPICIGPIQWRDKQTTPKIM
jgi:hypothetical protein